MWEPQAGLSSTSRRFIFASELKNSLGPLPVPGARLSVPPGSESLAVFRGHDHPPAGLTTKSHSHYGCRTRGVRQYKIQVTPCHTVSIPENVPRAVSWAQGDVASEAPWRRCETWVAVNIFPAWPDAAQQELHQAQARADLSHCIQITWWEPLPAWAAQPRALLPPTAAGSSGSCRDRDDMDRIPPATIKLSTMVKAYFILIFKLGILGAEKVR